MYFLHLLKTEWLNLKKKIILCECDLCKKEYGDLRYIKVFVNSCPVLLPGKSHGRRSLVGCSPWVTKNQARLSNFPFTFHFHALEKEMATHSSILAWRIPGTGEPSGLLSMGSHRVRHDQSDLTAAVHVFCIKTVCLSCIIVLCYDFCLIWPFRVSEPFAGSDCGLFLS